MANTSVVSKASPVIKICNCGKSHDFQDQKYGKGKRLANPTMVAADTKGPSNYRCTVCGELL